MLQLYWLSLEGCLILWLFTFAAEIIRTVKISVDCSRNWGGIWISDPLFPHCAAGEVAPLQAAHVSRGIGLDTQWADTGWQISCCTIHPKYVGIWYKYTPCHLLQCLGSLTAFLLRLVWKAVADNLLLFHPLLGFPCGSGLPRTREVRQKWL